jgi:hypothetical protein
MNLSFYLTLLNFLGIVGWIGVLFLVFFLSPYNNIQQNLSIFLISFFLAIFGSYSTLEFSLRKRLFKLSSPKDHLKDASRHGLLIAIALCVMLFLQYLKVLTWWDGGLLILIAISTELYLRSKNG